MILLVFLGTRLLSVCFASVADGAASLVQNVWRNLFHVVRRLRVFGSLLQYISFPSKMKSTCLKSFRGVMRTNYRLSPSSAMLAFSIRTCRQTSTSVCSKEAFIARCVSRADYRSGIRRGSEKRGYMQARIETARQSWQPMFGTQRLQITPHIRSCHGRSVCLLHTMQG